MTPKTCLYLPHFDFIATDFSQTEKNRFFEVISYHPKSGEEPKKVTWGIDSNPGFYGTIFVIGISKISSAPHAFNWGINLLTMFFWTTVWIL